MKRSQRCKLVNNWGDIQMHEWLASQSYKAKTSLINPDRLLIKYFSDKQALVPEKQERKPGFDELFKGGKGK